MDRIHIAQERKRWQTFVCVVTNIFFMKRGRSVGKLSELLTSQAALEWVESVTCNEEMRNVWQDVCRRLTLLSRNEKTRIVSVAGVHSRAHKSVNFSVAPKVQRCNCTATCKVLNETKMLFPFPAGATDLICHWRGVAEVSSLLGYYAVPIGVKLPMFLSVAAPFSGWSYPGRIILTFGEGGGDSWTWKSRHHDLSKSRWLFTNRHGETS